MPHGNERFPVGPGTLRLAALLALAALGLPAEGPGDAARFDRLLDQAYRQGSVRLIVQIGVPGIEALTSASTRFCGVDAEPAREGQRQAADAALGDAIALVAQDVLAGLRGTDYQLNGIFRTIPFLSLQASPDALIRLRGSPAVLGLEEDRPLRLYPPPAGTSEGNAGRKGPAAAADRPWLNTSVALIGAKHAWEMGYTGKGWYVAVLDTGIRRSHQFFRGKTIVESCFALGDDGLSPAGDCPNGKSSMSGTGSAAHYPDTYEGFDHGTHVSGIAAGKYGTLAGVAKDADIIAVQVFSKFPAADCGGSPCVMSWASDQLRGLEYVYSIRGRYPIAAVNMSLGGGYFETPCDGDSRKAAIDNLRSAGIATVIASGNDGHCDAVSAPACISSAVAVGASNDSDLEAYFNNWHPTLQKLFAPGVAIYSATGDSDSSYASWDGTSMATPHVTGAWALMKQADPGGGVAGFLSALETSGVPIASLCGGNPLPRIQVDEAIGVKPVLTVESSAFGTTQPPPGLYPYPAGTRVQVTAVPEEHADFLGWSGDASGTGNPVTVTMDGDRTVKAAFQYIYPPAASGRKQLNRSYSQAEYINILSWQAPVANQGLSIAGYRIYLNGTSPQLLAELGADQSTFSHRHQGAGSREYAVAAVTANGREGAPALVTVAAAQ